MVREQVTDQERAILHAIADVSGSVGFASDLDIAARTRLAVRDVRRFLDLFARQGLIHAANSIDRYTVRLSDEGRRAADADVSDEEAAILHAIGAMQPDSRAFVADTAIATRLATGLAHVRDLLDRLERKGLVLLARSPDGYGVIVTGEPDPHQAGYGEYRLRDRGIPIWAIIGSLTEAADNIDEVAAAYAIPRAAVLAALAFYERHKAAIDARLAQNAAT